MNYFVNKSAKSSALQPQPEKVLVKNSVASYAFANSPEVQDLICFSHLRWDFVYQRPQHLLSRASKQWKVWYIEEPQWSETLRLDIRSVDDQIRVVVPHLPHGIDDETAVRLQRQLVNQFLEQERLTNFIAWYYTPMALRFSSHLKPRLTVYDCMDELSAFSGASPLLLDQEEKLIRRADLVYTGGYSLYEAKQNRHPQVFAFPSCIDAHHFLPGRADIADPDDQRAIGGPRIGFCGVIDERLDLNLLRQLAQRRPDWQFVLLGPVVKIDPDSLPQAPNLHYLGMKNYRDLPAYFGNWQVAMMPFAINEATRYISPTKTPEYLAAGLPVVSTPIRDVVRSYGGWGPVLIGDSAVTLEKAIEFALKAGHDADWKAIDAQLKEQSWDNTWQQMQRLMNSQLKGVLAEQ
ncbi:glycosyltransferase family 1 protein [Spirosoma fluviale]|uniref:Glycosyl transferases group 1 n=1 Tax=Spirosoma fluviale TaxID=1597977 RepID=A0A286GN76_9BACT|nr:glycosyltransferase family 1 protein [Spirosoma fluviale]SOD97005.1 Glycosyl transferases group 1 [Spirosoma fluviale]